MKFWSAIGIACLLTAPSAAQTSYTLTMLDEETLNPLPGATVAFPDLAIGRVSDSLGVAVFEYLPDGTHTVTVRYLGYETKQFTRIFPLNPPEETVLLHPAHEELESLIVSSTRSSRLIEDIPTRVEVIAGEELGEKANMKPGDIRMLLNESTGIQTQQTSATSFNSSIRIQGLDGTYTQLLRDGLPLYSGYSGGLSIMQIPPLDLQQVEVIKGSSSTLYGGGAIAGLVNLISKRPYEQDGVEVMVNGTSALGLDLSSFATLQRSTVGATLFTSYNKGTAYDPAGIGLSAIPEFDRHTIAPTLFWTPTPALDIVLGVNWTAETRNGGNMEYLKGRTVADPYVEENLTDRFSTRFSAKWQAGEHALLQIKNSLSVYNRTVQVRGHKFGGRQVASFSELQVSRAAGSGSEWMAGLNLWTESFTQQAGDEAAPLDYTRPTLGGFVQNLWTPGRRWTLESGLRIDAQDAYGVFTLPRVSLMYKPGDAVTLRMGGGLGYKSPTVFTEETERLHFQNVLPIDADALQAERSTGMNLDVNYRMVLGAGSGAGVGLNTNVLLFHTRIRDPLVLAFEQGRYAYRQPSGLLRTQGMEINLKGSYRNLKLFVGYTYSDVIQERGSVQTPYPLVAKHRLNNVLMIEEHDNYRIGLEAYYFSPQQLGDGTTGRAYWILGIMTEKKLLEAFSLFLNFENLLDTRQTAFDTLFTGSVRDPVFRDIYAPVDGFVVNGGFKLRF